MIDIEHSVPEITLTRETMMSLCSTVDSQQKKIATLEKSNRNWRRKTQRLKKKQKAIKPIGDLNSVPHYRCPECFNGIVIYLSGPHFPYCQWCGQKLDWSGIDEPEM